MTGIPLGAHLADVRVVETVRRLSESAAVGSVHPPLAPLPRLQKTLHSRRRGGSPSMPTYGRDVIG